MIRFNSVILGGIYVMIKRPMLAVSCGPLDALKYPVLCSPKLDGIRCLAMNGSVVSRTLKPIPNEYIRNTLLDVMSSEVLGRYILDGELMVGESFQACTSGIMSWKGQPDFSYHVFDCIKVVDGCAVLDEPFNFRLARLVELLGTGMCSGPLSLVPHYVAADADGVGLLEDSFLGTGYEGLMIRSVDGAYKLGRSTLREGGLLKLKRFVDAEAEIVGVEEMQHNMNEATVDARGLTVRSSCLEGQVGAGTLGKFLVRDCASGVAFAIGTGVGLTAELRASLWAERDSLIGRLVKYRYQPHGVKDAPRCPIWLGFRSREDI